LKDSLHPDPVPSATGTLSDSLLCAYPLLFSLQVSLQVVLVVQLMQHLTNHAAARLSPADFTARMLLQRAGMEAAAEQLVHDEGLQQQLQGVLCTPQTSDAELLQSVHSFLQAQLLRQAVNCSSDLSLLHLAGLVAGAVEESSRQQQHQQQPQSEQQNGQPQSSSNCIGSVLLDTAAPAAADAVAAAGQRRGMAASQSPAVQLTTDALLHKHGAEAAVLQLAAADPALQQQLLGLIHTPGTSLGDMLAGMRLLLGNSMRLAMNQGSTVDLDVLELASLVEAACDAVAPEQQQQQQQQQQGALHVASSPSTSDLAAPAAAAVQQQQGYSVESLTPAMMRHRPCAEAAVLQLAAADPALQQQLLGLVHTPATTPSELLNSMRLLLRDHLSTALQQRWTPSAGVLRLAELVEGALAYHAGQQQPRQQQQQEEEEEG
jgi:hypothetical protein